MNDKLKHAILTQLGEDAEELLPEIAKHGAEAGWPGFTYYSDTTKFTTDNRDLIIDEMISAAENLGETPLEMLKWADKEASDREIINFLRGRESSLSLENGIAFLILEMLAHEYEAENN